MRNYLKYFKETFSLPILRGNNEQIEHRASNPLELFFDLIFVAVLSKVGHLFYYPTFENIFLAISLYLSIFIIWISVSMFTIRFFGPTYIIRISIGIIMIPILYIVGLDANTPINIQIIALSFTASRIILIFMWYFIGIKNNKFENDHYKKNLKIDIQAFVLSSIITTIPFFYPTTRSLSIFLLLSTVCELFYTLFFYKRSDVYSFNDKMPKFDYNLLKERQILFIILVYGEGLISAANSINLNSGNLFLSLSVPVMMFLTAYLFFIRVYEEFILLNFKENAASLNYLHITTTFTFLLLYSIMGAITHDYEHIYHVKFEYKVLLLIALIYIITWHVFHNTILLRNKEINKTERMVTFLKFDNATLIIMYVFTALIAITSNGYIILFLLLLMFLVHALPVPYRYDKFKDIIEEEFETFDE